MIFVGKVNINDTIANVKLEISAVELDVVSND